MQKNISGMILVCIMSVIGLALTPTIQENVLGVTSTGSFGAGLANSTFNNLTGSSRTIMLLFPMFWVILMIAIPVAYISIWLRSR